MSLELSEKAREVKPSSTLAISAKAKQMQADGIDVVGFGAGEPDFTTPKNICDAAEKAIEEGFTKYTPASGTNELKQAVSEKFRKFNGLTYKPSQIVISNGGKHALTNIFTVLVNPGDEVIIPAPYWLSYPEMVKLAGGVPVFVYGAKDNGFKPTAQQIEAAVTDRTKALVLNTPNNPTGMIYTKEELEAIAEVAVSRDFYVIADEMYEQLVYCGKQHVSIAGLGSAIYERTITCSGLSKSYAMTGWRVGYIGAPEKIAKLIGAVQSHQTSNVCSIAQKAAVEALNGPQDSVEAMRKEFDARRQHMADRLAGIPDADFLVPEGAFYFFVGLGSALKKSYKGETVGTAARLAEIMLNDFHVVVVPCADFGFPDYVRLSYATSMEVIDKGLDRIAACLKALG
ncbi:MAG: pyridoxal phosphate-dependent aminotransferase [Lachnospiraceae bacterium]|jgi:aspartate aminotransferase|nr:pyridoxal phosphate-dependent aminotransferase [Lachnospiraceae bacterium]